MGRRAHRRSEADIFALMKRKRAARRRARSVLPRHISRIDMLIACSPNRRAIFLLTHADAYSRALQTLISYLSITSFLAMAYNMIFIGSKTPIKRFSPLYKMRLISTGFHIFHAVVGALYKFLLFHMRASTLPPERKR